MAGTVHVGGTLDEIASAEAAAWDGRIADRPFVLVTQPTVADSSRAPAGRHVAWGYCHVPHGSTVDMTERIESQIERFAPGFRDTILARHAAAPRDLERANPNLVGGDIGGGALDLGQLFARPTWRGYRTSAPGLYLCSSSTPPGGGVHGMWLCAGARVQRCRTANSKRGSPKSEVRPCLIPTGPSPPTRRGFVWTSFWRPPIDWVRAVEPWRRSSAARCSSTTTKPPPPTPARAAVRGDRVRVWMDRPGSSKRRPAPHQAGDLNILYEDDDLIAVNKPPGLLAVPLERKADAESVFDQIDRHLRSHRTRRPFTVHRIDRDTSGVVVFAKHAAAQAVLKQQFLRHEPERVYQAIVYGHPTPPSGTWRDTLVWDQRSLIQKETHRARSAR